MAKAKTTAKAVKKGGVTTRRRSVKSRESSGEKKIIPDLSSAKTLTGPCESTFNVRVDPPMTNEVIQLDLTGISWQELSQIVSELRGKRVQGEKIILEEPTTRVSYNIDSPIVNEKKPAMTVPENLKSSRFLITEIAERVVNSLDCIAFISDVKTAETLANMLNSLRDFSSVGSGENLVDELKRLNHMLQSLHDICEFQTAILKDRIYGS